VGSTLALAAWSLLAAPEGVEVRGYGVRPATEQNVPGYVRFTTDEIDAGDRVELTLRHAAAGAEVGDVFEQVAAAQEAREETEEENGGGPNYLPLIFLGGLLIVILVGALRKRG
jgi:hypothetical protein